MSRRLELRAVVWTGFWLGSWASGGGAQPVTPPAAPAVPADLGAAARRMGDEVRRLGQDVAADLKGTPRGARVLEGANELARAVDEFRDALSARGDRFQVRQAFAGIDASWHYLAAELSQPGASSPAVDRDAQSVARTDAQIHRMLGMNDLPPGYYQGEQALAGMAEVQRLAHALVDRAEALAAAVRLDLTGPDAADAVADAVNLAQVVDTFHDALDLNGRVDVTVQNGFSGVAGIADRVENDLRQVRMTPRVQAAWRNYRAAEVLVRKALNLPISPADANDTLLAPSPRGASPVVALADQLVQQTADFIRVFGPSSGAVSEGGLFLADAQALQNEATNFRQDAAGGLDPARLAFEFRNIDAVWQRLARRTARIARGRTGPNVQQVGRIGQTVGELHRLLGVPGYVPVIAAP